MAAGSEFINQVSHNLLTTRTHDPKRGKDTRARMAAISERSAWFTEKVELWYRLARPLRTELEDGVAPTLRDELTLYQTLLACWPLTLVPGDKPGMETFLVQLLRWQEKVIRETKLRRHWEAPNSCYRFGYKPDYESDYQLASAHFLIFLMTGDDTQELRQDIAAAAASLAPAGAINSLSQTLLRMTSPGVVDLYQGTEFYQGADLWDFSLLETDHRPVMDFAPSINALATNDETLPNELMQYWQDGRIKQWLIKRTLTNRKQYPALFTQGDYQPLAVEGERANHVHAFAREHNGNCMIVITPRLATHLLADNSMPIIPAAAWGDTVVLLPQHISSRTFAPMVTGAPRAAHGGRLPVREVLGEFPVHISIAAHLPAHPFNQHLNP